jgi:hypothetical protein
MIERSSDLLADYLTKRRIALHKVRMPQAHLERFEKAKGRAPVSAAELRAFLFEERLNGKRL